MHPIHFVRKHPIGTLVSAAVGMAIGGKVLGFVTGKAGMLTGTGTGTAG